MAVKACGKGRCPARADVFEWTTTEYRKGCRRQPCTAAHTLAEQRRRAKKAAEASEAAAMVTATATLDPPAAAAPAPDDDEHDVDVTPSAGRLVQLVQQDLDAIDSDHPFASSYAGVALAMAGEIAARAMVPTMVSGVSAAKTLVDVMERLRPKEAEDTELDDLLGELMDADDVGTDDEADVSP